MRIFRSAPSQQQEAKVSSNHFYSFFYPWFSMRSYLPRYSPFIFFTFGAGVLATYQHTPFKNFARIPRDSFAAGLSSGLTNQFNNTFSSWSDQFRHYEIFLPKKYADDPFLTFPALPSGPNENRESQEKWAEWFIEKLPSSMTLPNLFSLEEIISWGQSGNSQTKSNATPLKCCITVDCNSLDTAGMACMNDAIRQTASQPDLGETRYYYDTHPREFVNDPTQGPSEQRTAYFAALARWIHRKECDGLSEIKTHPEFQECFDYRNGRLTPRLNKEEKALHFLRKHVNKIKLNVQRVQIDGTQNRAIQVLNFALALGSSWDNDIEKRDKAGLEMLKEMAEILLIHQYKAVASVAVMEARKHPEKEFPLSLTLVGGNMFGNSPDSIQKGLEAACEVIRNAGTTNVIPVLSAFFPENVDLYKTGSLANATVLTESDLAKLTKISDAFSKKPCTPHLGS